ncbi:ABC transporter substrate-binding protein [Meiothermus granaticius]|uniref:Putative ABC transporter-binding protein n=1 Tax=Meiothermus granaticius NBRC 107808 TaxID=1227551 RepID=A0A399F8Q1_9DEIN|nr:ABC transporter substrate-binding protein [Meiothermus granaticius]MCL6526837.1 ABC transporter substrate-binding protein [Thermaceae bacterium]RIH92473.1 putative ABC transporter-binding protein [Meiothermus granaticius NBRC 107808]GEM87171.1 sugar ABC transporter substrate-binding protein [Meiothermus granaticius NBRC 107808]
MKKLVWLWLGVFALSFAMAQTKIRVFVGGQQRPEIWRKILDNFEKANPGVKVEVEVGGATSDQQQQYLTTVLASRDPSIDAILIDIVRPAQYAAAKWADPLDKYLPGVSKANLLKQLLPAYAQADEIDGKLYALPSFADAEFLYYRKDLLEKYGLKPPTTWDETIKAAQTILAGEKNPNLNGIGFMGNISEGTVCSFLLPIWASGNDVADKNGKLTLTEDQARASLQFWLDLMDKYKVSPPNMAEKAQDTIRNEMQQGRWIFGTLFAYAWNRFQTDPDSQVKGKIGVVPLPKFEGGRAASCLGGWQWTISDFSRNKALAYKVVKYLTSPEASKILAVDASNLPVYPALYKDPDVLKANPWFADALPVVLSARSRPVSPRYPEIADVMRKALNAVLARTKTPDAAAKEVIAGLQAIYSGK